MHQTSSFYSHKDRFLNILFIDLILGQVSMKSHYHKFSYYSFMVDAALFIVPSIVTSPIFIWLHIFTWHMTFIHDISNIFENYRPISVERPLMTALCNSKPN